MSGGVLRPYIFGIVQQEYYFRKTSSDRANYLHEVVMLDFVRNNPVSPRKKACGG